MVVILFVLDPHLALLTFLALPVLAVGAFLFRIASADAYRLTREKIALDHRLPAGDAVRDPGGPRVRPGAQAHRPASASSTTSNRAANMTTVNLNAAYFPAVEFLSALVTVEILVIGGIEAINGHTSTGVVFAFIAALNNFFDPIQQLSQLYTTYQSGMAALDKIFEPARRGARAVRRPGRDRRCRRSAASLRFDDVSFRYGSRRRRRMGTARPRPRRVPPARRSRWSGATGAGKSTFAKLVARFYDPTEGRVLVDGHDLRTVDRAVAALADGDRPPGGVPVQRHGAREHRVRATGRDRRGDPDRRPRGRRRRSSSRRWTDGYDTQVGERGVQLSAGQRQLLAFARALVADPRILVLDEATSNVDVHTESLIEQGMRRLVAGRTAIVIAHRLSTIRHAGRIVVLEHGRIVESGSHDELIEAEGRYWQLYRDWAEQAAA